jgi:hypothetical protein
MADRDDDKIISLDQRRLADQARQKAELAAARKASSNGSGRTVNRGFDQPARARPSGGFARGLGAALAWLLYVGFAATIALAVYGWMIHAPVAATAR